MGRFTVTDEERAAGEDGGLQTNPPEREPGRFRVSPEESELGTDREALFTPLRIAQTFGNETLKGIARVLGLPGDAVQFGLEHAGIAEPEKYIAGGEDIIGMLQRLGVIKDVDIGKSTAARLTRNVGEEFGATLPFAAALLFPSGAGQAKAVTEAATRAENVFKAIWRTMRKQVQGSPLKASAVDAALATTGGTGRTIAQEVAPGSPTADIVGNVAGTIAPSIAVPAAARLVPPLVKKGVKAVTTSLRPFHKGGREAATAEQLRALTTDPDQALANINNPIHLDGADLTPAQKANDPGLFALEKSVISTNAELGAGYRQSVTSTNEAAIRELHGITGGEASGSVFQEVAQGRIDKLSELVTKRIRNALRLASDRVEGITPTQRAGESSAVVKKELDQAFKDVRAQESALWDEIQMTQGAPTQPTKDANATIRNRHDPVVDDPGNLPDELMKIADNLKGTETTERMLGFRNRVLEAIRKENGKPSSERNGRLVANMEILQESILDSLGILARDEANPNVKLIQAALKFTREQVHDRFTRGEIGRLLGYKASGEARTAGELTLDKLVRPDIEGELGIEALERAIRAGEPPASAAAPEADVPTRLDEIAPVQRAEAPGLEVPESLRVPGAAASSLPARVGKVSDTRLARVDRAVRDYIKDEFLKAATNPMTNEITPEAAALFMSNKRHGATIDKLPGLREELSGVTEAATKARDLQRGEKLSRASIDKSRAALYADVEDIQRAVAKTFNSARPTEGFTELAKLARSDKTGRALIGLKNAVVEHMITKSAFGAAVIDESGSAILKGTKLAGFIKSNQKALRAVGFDGPDIMRMEHVSEVMKRVERSMGAEPLPGSPTAARLTILQNVIGRILGANVGARLGGSKVPSLQRVGIFSGAMRKILQSATEDDLKNLIGLAVSDASTYSTLVRKVTAKNAGEVTARLRAHLLTAGARVPDTEDESGDE